jgi:hypothetical protein
MGTRLDEWFLSLFQSLSDWLHCWTGLDCIHQSRVCSAVVAAGFVGFIVIRLAESRMFDWVLALCVFANLYSAFWENTGDEVARQAGASGFRNPRRIHPVELWSRLAYTAVACLLLVLNIVFWHASWPDLVIFAGWWRGEFSACDVQTPRTGRIREALNNLAGLLARKPVVAS